MIELIAIPIATGIGAIWMGKRYFSDEHRLEKVFEACKLYVTKGSGDKLKQDKMKLIRKEEHEWGTEYTYRLPVGLSFEQVQACYPAIKDGLNYKEGLDRHVEIFYEGALKIQVYREPIPKMVQYDRGLIQLCQSWEIPLGMSYKELVFHDFEKSPHMLVAGTTRYGKTVFLKNIITTLTVQQPENVIFSLIDLKGMLAFSRFEHLRQVKYTASNGYEALDVLQKVVHEMNRRMERFRGKYEDVTEANLRERHFIIVDEGAQLSSRGTRDLKLKKVLQECERLMEEIARIGGGLGFRLIYATQYPLRENLPANIKQNCDAKVVFRLQNEVASRTVMDYSGAEQLPRKDDSYKGGRAIYMTDAPIIVQTPFAENHVIEELIKPYRVQKTEEKEEQHHANDVEEPGEGGGHLIQFGSFGVFNTKSNSKVTRLKKRT